MPLAVEVAATQHHTRTGLATAQATQGCQLPLRRRCVPAAAAAGVSQPMPLTGDAAAAAAAAEAEDGAGAATPAEAVAAEVAMGHAALGAGVPGVGRRSMQGVLRQQRLHPWQATACRGQTMVAINHRMATVAHPRIRTLGPCLQGKASHRQATAASLHAHRQWQRPALEDMSHRHWAMDDRLQGMTSRPAATALRH